MITQTSFFTGRYKIASNKFSDLQSYIDEYEPKYLRMLMGADLYALFVADLVANVPQTARFISVFDPFNIDDGDCLMVSEGIKKMLVQFIYYHYVVDMAFTNTQAGNVRNSMELSEQLGYKGSNTVQAYNEGVNNYKSIQWFICDNSEDYPEENSQYLTYTSGI